MSLKQSAHSSINTLRANIALVLLSLFIVASIFVNSIRRDLSFVSNFLSEYAVNDFGVVQISGFICIAIAHFMVALLVKSSGGGKHKLGSLLLISCSMAVLLVAIFPTDIGMQTTKIGKIHFAAAVFEFNIFPFAAMFSTFLLRSQMGKNLTLQILFILCLLCFVMLFALVVVMYGVNELGIAGLIQKVYITVITIWLAFAAHLFRPSYSN